MRSGAANQVGAVIDSLSFFKIVFGLRKLNDHWIFFSQFPLLQLSPCRAISLDSFFLELRFHLQIHQVSALQ